MKGLAINVTWKKKQQKTMLSSDYYYFFAEAGVCRLDLFIHFSSGPIRIQGEFVQIHKKIVQIKIRP